MRWGIIILIVAFGVFQGNLRANHFVIHADDPRYIELAFFDSVPQADDTIFIASDRVKGITLIGLSGSYGHPIVITNQNGQVQINDPDSWSAFLFKNCQYIKLIGNGDDQFHYGFTLSAQYSGVNVGNNSTNFEIAFIEIDHLGFVGIQVKDDYGGNPPEPLPEFRELVIHDCFIQNVTEGMYLGETKSPGLEFRYVRVFNNVVLSTGREGIQLANMVEDVVVRNNFINNSGLDNLPGQGNNIQIGDNTVADVYNNVLINANEYGVIVFGMGHINIDSNYIAGSNGLFIDNRKFTDFYSSINVQNNYFDLPEVDDVVLNYNEYNYLDLSNNYYQGADRFYRSNCDTCSNVTLLNNNKTAVSVLNYELNGGLFIPEINNMPGYKIFGPIAYQDYQFNSWPEFDELEDVYVDKGSTTESIISVSTHDNDSLIFSFENLPNFISVETLSNGKVKLLVDAQNQNIAIYNVIVSVIDVSHKVEIRKPFKVVVKAVENHPPQIQIGSEFWFYTLTKSRIDFKVVDVDGDHLHVELEEIPDFIKLFQLNETDYVLFVEPGYSNQGDYLLNIKVDDGYSGIVESKVILRVDKKNLEMGDLLYRFNCGGPCLVAEPLNWNDGASLLYNFSDQSLQSTGSYSWTGTNETGAPDSLFGPYTFIKPKHQSMQLRFSCEPLDYEVKLYFTERQQDFDSIGPTVMQVMAEGELVISQVVLNDELINKAMVESFIVQVFDSTLNIDLVPVENFAKLNGLEISVAFPFNINESEDKFMAFPNPFSYSFYIANDVADQLLDWHLYYATGKLADSGVFNDYFVSFKQVEIGELPTGLYYLILRTQHKMISQKMLRK